VGVRFLGNPADNRVERCTPTLTPPHKGEGNDVVPSRTKDY